MANNGVNSQTLLNPGGVPSADGVSVPDNSNLSAQYNSSPSSFGFTSQDMNLQVTTGWNTSTLGPVAGPVIKQKGSAQQMPMWQYMTTAAHQSADQIASQQKALYDAGFYDNSYYSSSNKQAVITGAPDAAYLKALHNAATEAIASRGNLSVDDVISQHTAAMQAMNQGGSQKKLHLTNPADVAANAISEGYKVTGQQISPDAVAAIQANAEQTAQDTFDNSGDTNTASFTPSAAWLDQQIAAVNPNLTKNYSAFNNFEAASQLFGTAGSPIANLYHQ